MIKITTLKEAVRLLNCTFDIYSKKYIFRKKAGLIVAKNIETKQESFGIGLLKANEKSLEYSRW